MKILCKIFHHGFCPWAPATLLDGTPKWERHCTRCGEKEWRSRASKVFPFDFGPEVIR